jgi:hypothetical protein
MGLFPSGFSTIRATCPAHLILLDLITQIFGKEPKPPAIGKYYHNSSSANICALRTVVRLDRPNHIEGNKLVYHCKHSFEQM